MRNFSDVANQIAEVCKRSNDKKMEGVWVKLANESSFTAPESVMLDWDRGRQTILKMSKMQLSYFDQVESIWMGGTSGSNTYVGHNPIGLSDRPTNFSSLIPFLKSNPFVEATFENHISKRRCVGLPGDGTPSSSMEIKWVSNEGNSINVDYRNGDLNFAKDGSGFSFLVGRHKVEYRYTNA